MAKPPIDLDERMVESHLPRAADKVLADPDIAALASAIRTAREGALSLQATADAYAADRTRTPHDAALMVRDAALRTGTAIAPIIDTARGRIRQVIDRIDKETAAPAPKDMHMEPEIRAALSRMHDDDRDKVINNAFAEKNLRVVGAVLRADAFLSGIGTAKLESLRHRYRLAFHAEDHARKERLTKALDAAERAAKSFVGFLTQHTETEKARLAEVNRAAVTEAHRIHEERMRGQ